MTTPSTTTKNRPGCCVDRLWAERNKNDPSPERRADAESVARKACNDSTCMTLPQGKSCGDCVHVERCKKIFGVKPERTTCDFFPRRFVARAIMERIA